MGDRGDVGEEALGRVPWSSITEQDPVLVLLSLAAGCVDAVSSYLGLNHVFRANMTGNTVLLGIALGQAQGRAALRSGLALTGFVLGVAAGAVIVERGREDVVWPSVVTVALALECAVLVAFALGWYLAGAPAGKALYSLIALSALAMGIQSIAVRRLGVSGVATTFVTGTLTSLRRRLIDRLRSAVSAAVSEGHDTERPEQETTSAHDLAQPAAVWLVYGVGAVVVGLTELRWRSAATLLPAAVVAVVAVTAAIRYRHR